MKYAKAIIITTTVLSKQKNTELFRLKAQFPLAKQTENSMSRIDCAYVIKQRTYRNSLPSTCLDFSIVRLPDKYVLQVTSR